MAYQGQSLTDKVKSLLGGAAQQAPKVLGDIGRYIQQPKVFGMDVPDRIANPPQTRQISKAYTKAPTSRVGKTIQSAMGTAGRGLQQFGRKVEYKPPQQIDTTPFQPLARFTGTIARDFGESMERHSTPQGRQQFIAGSRKLPTQIKQKQYLQALENPATQDILNFSDLLPGGLVFGGVRTLGRRGLTEGGEQILKASAKSKILKQIGKKIDARDVDLLDQAVDVWRRRKKFKPEEVDAAKNVFYDMTEKYLPKWAQPENADINAIARTFQKITKEAESISGGTTLSKLAKGEFPTLKIGLGTEDVSKQPTLKVKGDDVIEQAKKQIGKQADEPTKGLRQMAHDFYTQWVDRFHPLTKASGEAKKTLKSKGAELRPEYDPEHLVRRLTGAGGIADQRFRTELDPIIKQADDMKIPRADLDVYLANKRMVGFDKAGRDIYGVDTKKSQAVVTALEQKYNGIKELADQFYKYQDKGLEEMVEAGFITKADASAMRKQNPDYSPLYRIMDEVDEYLGIPTRKTMQGSQPIMKIKGSKKQIQSPLESIIGNTYSHRAAIEKNRVAQAVVNLQNIVDMGFKKVSKSGNDTITVWQNGKKQYWEVGKEIADVAKGANEENMNLILKALQTPASILRQGATGRNPAFMIPNIVRDQLDAGITSKYGYIPFIDYASGLKSMLTNDDAYKSWANSGAKIDLGEMSGRKDVTKYIDDKKTKRTIRSWISEVLDVAGKYSEQPTRVGLYKRAIKKTGNPLLAAMESRDATVDFARMGSKMKTANSTIPFLNVGVQGFDKLIRSLRDRPGRVLAMMTAYATVPALTTTLYNLQNYPEAYQNIPDYVKESNFVIITGTNEDGTANYLTLPKGNIVPIAANPTTSFVEHLYGQDQESFKELVLNVMSGTLPILGQGSTAKEIAIKTVGQNIPQAAKPTIESLVNKSFYKYDPKKEEAGKDQSIVPYWMKDRPAYEQHHGKYTPKAYQKIGAVLNISPLHVKNWMEGTFSGYTNIPVKISEILSKASEGEEISQNDVPLLRRFYKQTWDLPKYEKKEKPEVPGVMERIGIAPEVDATEKLPETKLSDEDTALLYKELKKEVKAGKVKLGKIRIGMSDDDMEEVSKERGDAVMRLNKLRREHPEIIFDADMEVYKSGGGMKVEERGEWAYTSLGGAKNEADAQDMINKMWESGVLTTGSKGTAQWLKDEYGINVYKYTGTDSKIKKKVSSGTGKKKGKKVTLGRITPRKASPIKISFGKLPAPTIAKTPKLTLKQLTNNQKDYRIKVQV